MASGIYCMLSCPHCDETIEAMFAAQTIPCPHCGRKVKRPIFPALDNATNQIHRLNVVPHSKYIRLSLDEKRGVFAVPGIENTETLATIKKILGDCFEKGIDLEAFELKLHKAFGRTLALSPACVEKVFRGNVNRALIHGLLKTLDEPLITSGFPYLMFSACADDRTPATHLALEHFGLNGTAIYRRDDPFWRRFMPPLTDLCRCAVNQLTLRMAAEKGVKEAQEWLKSRKPPNRPEWVKFVAYDPRLDLEDEWWPDLEQLENPQGILKEVLAARAHLIQEMEKASLGPRRGRLPRGVRMPTTLEGGLALLQGRIDAAFTLPPLVYYFRAMASAEIKNIPPWKGEPENELQSLEAIDGIIACCRQSIDQGWAPGTE